MHPDLNKAVTWLPGGRLLRIGNGQGRTISVARGTVWITQENDGRDVLVHGGESFTFDRAGVAIVHALDSTAVLMLEDGITAERVVLPAPLPIPDVSPGSRLYRRAHRLRNDALDGFAQAFALNMSCAARNLLYRVGWVEQPC